MLKLNMLVSKRIIQVAITSLLLLFSSCSNDKPIQEQNIVNDVTQLNPIKVNSVIVPATSEEIIKAVKQSSGPISI
ncbi:MAG: hypothetical protein WC622_02210, partial [Pedobacter sp.]|uniref:hypothetical protein n=1 Tax=Pedobacter sp. TaxID=1411316 RepID=UPI0035694D3B